MGKNVQEDALEVKLITAIVNKYSIYSDPKMNSCKCYVIEADVSDELVHLKGYICETVGTILSVGFEVTVRKISWEDFQRRLEEWQFHSEMACTFVNKEQIYITEITFREDKELEGRVIDEHVQELESFRDPALGMQYFGLPEIVFQHLIGQLLY